MIRYKIDVIAALKEAGVSTYTIMQTGMISQASMTKMRGNQYISFSTLNSVCALLGRPIGDIIEFIVTDEDREKYGEYLKVLPVNHDKQESDLPVNQELTNYLTPEEASAYGHIFGEIEKEIPDLKLKKALVCPGKELFRGIREAIAHGKTFDRESVMDKVRDIDISHADYILDLDGQNRFIAAYMQMGKGTV